MKLVNLFALALVIFTGSQANAVKPKENPACANVVKACEAAGFKAGDHKKNGKGLWVDCVHQLAAGKPVEGVTVAQAEAEACKASAKEHREEKKEAREAKK